VATRRTVDVFVSRLHPLTSDKELIECANETAASCDIKVVDLACTQLKSKYEHLYSSFHFAVCVEVQQFKAAIDEFMSAEAWPSGILVKRFLNQKMDQHCLRLCTFNCRSVKRTLSEVHSLCEGCDFLFMQEHWLLPTELDILNNISSEMTYIVSGGALNSTHSLTWNSMALAILLLT